MPSSPRLITQVQYRRFLKPLLPERAFLAAPRKLFLVALHLVIIVANILGIRYSAHWLFWFLCSMLIGHSLACIAFLAHELSHNAIIRNKWLRYPIELLVWSPNFISPTVWRRVHNHTHHPYANTLKDPDRQFLVSENSLLSRIYTRTFYPNRYSFRWNPLVGAHFVPYIIRNTVAVFFPNSCVLPLVPSKPLYNLTQRLTIVFELGMMAFYQLALFSIVGGTWDRFLFASPIPVLISSSVVMAYVFTNHFLAPISKVNDLVANTWSVRVAKCLDRMHCNFSYHTEHHIFPSMNSDYYPALSELLSAHYTNVYKRVGIVEAWTLLWSNELFVNT